MINYDKAFEIGKHIPNAHKIIKEAQNRSAEFRNSMLAAKNARLDVKYGPSARNTMDVFTPSSPVRANLIFLHSGSWFKSDKSLWSHLAQGSLQNDVRVIIPNYTLCPNASIPEITQQIKNCVEAVAAEFSGPVIIAGHQSGGHLAARMACAGVLNASTSVRLSHVLPISPICDLTPLIYTSMNKQLHLTEEIAALESPTILDLEEDTTVTVWVGSDERPVYIEQAKLLASRWDCYFVSSKNRNHYDVIDGMEIQTSKLLGRLFFNIEA
ncbi:alpha/beta hydrolase [Planktomarina sp.]|nr:alpha/beta hydrolase [Planktomarina sp.]